MNAKVYKFPKRKNKHVSMKLIIFLTGILILSFYILNTRIFVIKNIEVSGNYYLSKSDIVSMSGIHNGLNIFTLNTDKIIDDLQRNPLIKSINIRRILPNSIIIEVDERNEVAVIPYEGVYLKIDEDGIVIEVSNQYVNTELPILSGLNIKRFFVGQYLDIKNTAMFNRSLDILKSLKENNMMELISEVRIDGDNITLISSSGFIINFDVDKNLDYRLSFLKSVLIDLMGKNVNGGYIIVNDSGNIIYRPVEEQEEEYN